MTQEHPLPQQPQRPQRQVSFDPKLRVRKHIHRSSITTEEMEQTWYSKYEIRAARTRALAYKKKLEEERTAETTMEQRRLNRIDILLSSALRTMETSTTSSSTETETSGQSSVGSYDRTHYNVRRKGIASRSRRGSSQLLKRSTSIRGLNTTTTTTTANTSSPGSSSKGRSKSLILDVTNTITTHSEEFSAKPTTDKRKQLRRSNSLPALLVQKQHDLDPVGVPLNYELLQRPPKSFRSNKGGQRSFKGLFKPSRFSNLKESPKILSRKQFSPLAEATLILEEGEEEAPLDYAI